MNLAGSERVSRAVTLPVGARDSVGASALKKTRKCVLFSCSVAAVGLDELAVVVDVVDFWGCEKTSSEVGGVA